MKIIFIFILIIILILFYIEHISIDNFINIDLDDIIVIVWDEEFYYLNIKNINDYKFTIYKIPFNLINDFF
jgi:hypothetical protein